MKKQTNSKNKLKMGLVKCDICNYQTTSYPIYFIDVYSHKRNKSICPRKYVCDECYIRLKKYKNEKRILLK